MILSADELWVGFMEGVDGVAVVVNHGKPTQQIFSVGMWTALNAGLELTRRGAILISGTLADFPQATAEQIRRMDS